MDIQQTTNLKNTIYTDSLFIREEVFMKEQNIPKEIEIDDKDDQATHYTGYNKNGPITTLRVIKINDQTAKLQRIATLKEYRQNGYAKALIKYVLADLKKQGFREVLIGAQSYKIPYYEKIGFKVISEEFMEANIPHKTMSITL